MIWWVGLWVVLGVDVRDGVCSVSPVCVLSSAKCEIVYGGGGGAGKWGKQESGGGGGCLLSACCVEGVASTVR